MPGTRDERIPIDPEGVQQLLADLARVKVEFQLRAIAAVVMAGAKDARPVVTTCPICQASNPCPKHPFSAQCDYHRSRGE